MTKSINKLHVITLGCAKNIYDSEVIRGRVGNHFELTSDPEEAETIIINTCGFIQAAKEESIETILQAAQLKKTGNLKNLVVAGCMSARYQNELIKEMPEVDAFFGTEAFDQISSYLGIRTDLKQFQRWERNLTTPPHYAYLKISEGCSRQCSFCSIPLIRGLQRSRPIEDLVAEAKGLAARGIKELIIISQDTTDYGRDLYGKERLMDLLRELVQIQELEWIRLLYLYPSAFPEELIEWIAREEKMVKYIDMPLQHLSDEMLKSMRRGINTERTFQLLNRIRTRIPDIVIRTTFIVGFPGETDEHFQELIDGVRKMRFDRLGVFTYSKEEGTFAYDLPNQIRETIKNQRRDQLMEVQREISESNNETWIGRKVQMIVDRWEDDHWVGRSYGDAPEVDNEIWVPSGSENQIGKIIPVSIREATEYDLYGEWIGMVP